ncbi:MAG: CFI-box-CTERM domain-containing protein [Thermodesulfovibrionales bacterium]
MGDDHKEEYEKGKQDANEAGLCDEIVHGAADTAAVLFPKTDKAKAYEAGWKDGMDEKSGCFITTACVEAKGFSDNCHALNTLRVFRDEYVKHLPTGEQAICEYYKIAPQIVAKINKSENRDAIYINLYERLILKSLNLIESGEKGEAFKNYMLIVNELKQGYL